jgi:hypothetical protein
VRIVEHVAANAHHHRPVSRYQRFEGQVTGLFTTGHEPLEQQLTADQESKLASLVIPACLTAASIRPQIVYGRSAEASSSEERSIDPREIRRGNPNDPCPCGSGRKLKSCCGRRPRR